MPRNMRTECQEQDIEPRKVVNDIVHRQCELESIFLLQGAGQMSMLGDYSGDRVGAQSSSYLASFWGHTWWIHEVS